LLGVIEPELIQKFRPEHPRMTHDERVTRNERVALVGLFAAAPFATELLALVGPSDKPALLRGQLSVDAPQEHLARQPLIEYPFEFAVELRLAGVDQIARIFLRVFLGHEEVNLVHHDRPAERGAELIPVITALAPPGFSR